MVWAMVSRSSVVEPALPRVMVALRGRSFSALESDSLTTLIEAGADAFLVAPERDASLGHVQDQLARLRAHLPPAISLIVEDSPSLAASIGAGLLLAEWGLSTAEARRQLGPGGLLGRTVTSPEAAAAASGADFLLIESSSHSRASLRVIVETAWSPLLVAIVATCREVEQQTESLVAAGVEGLVLQPQPSASQEGLIASLGMARRLLPPGWFDRRSAPHGEPTVTIDSVAHALLPDTAITDLLSDVERMGAVAVSVNGVRIARRLWDDTLLSPGDDIQIAAK